MILSCINIALVLAFIGVPVLAIVYLSKKQHPFMKPLLLGSATMLIGYFGSSFLMVILDLIITSSGGEGFINTGIDSFYLAIATGIAITGLMTFMLAKPLKDCRSGDETLAYAAGVIMLMLIVRAIDVVSACVTAIQGGADYATSGVLLAQGGFTMTVCYLDAFCAVMLADFINRGKLWQGALITLAAELLVNASSSANSAFGLPYIIYPVVAGFVMAATLLYDLRAWKNFPKPERDIKVRRGKQDIQWPDEGDDGR